MNSKKISEIFKNMAKKFKEGGFCFVVVDHDESAKQGKVVFKRFNQK